MESLEPLVDAIGAGDDLDDVLLPARTVRRFHRRTWSEHRRFTA